MLDILKIKSRLGKEFKEKKKPRLMICCNLWMIGGIERVMQQLINYFEQKYEIVLVSYVVQGKAYELPDSVGTFLFRKSRRLCLLDRISSKQVSNIFGDGFII